jgi:hypothetical protein
VTANAASGRQNSSGPELLSLLSAEEVAGGWNELAHCRIGHRFLVTVQPRRTSIVVTGGADR